MTLSLWDGIKRCTASVCLSVCVSVRPTVLWVRPIFSKSESRRNF